MKGLTSVVSWSGLALAIGVGLLSVDAQAATSLRVYATNPAGICQSALPVFDGVIRKRPKAVQNEGDGAAFITCAFQSQGPDAGSATDVRNPTQVRVYFVASDSVADTVTCTGVAGYAGQPIPSVTKSVNVSSPSSSASIAWNPGDFTEGATVLPSSLFAVSCSLNPGVGIVDSYVYFSEEVGS